MKPHAIVAIVALVLAGRAAASPCPSIAGEDTILRPGAVVLLGELHGTNEAPRAVAGLVCHAVEKKIAVTVALELPRSESAGVATYFASGGTESDRGALLAGAFWQRDYQDGRTSAAMVDLLEALRALRAAGHDVRAVLIDDPTAEGGREQAMAGAIAAAVEQAPGRLLVALTGNIHNRLTRGTPWNAEHEPMGFLLARAHPDLDIVSLALTSSGGTAWICNSGSPEDCGARKVGGKDAAAGIEILPAEPDAEERPVSGRWHLGAITASPPAKAAAERGPAP